MTSITDWTIQCPFCKTVHDLEEEVNCKCGAYGSRKGIGWMWNKPPAVQHPPKDDKYCTCFSKYAYQNKDGDFICEECGKKVST